MNFNKLMLSFMLSFAVTSMLTSTGAAQEISGLAGDWIYVKDITKDRPVEKRQPSMSAKFEVRVEKDAIVFLRGSGSSKREERIKLDGSVTKKVMPNTTTNYSGGWKEGVLRFKTEIKSNKDKNQLGLIQSEFRQTKGGLLVRVRVGSPPVLDSTALYRHPKDIVLPTPAKATIKDMAWLSGAWVSEGRRSSTEERWTPAKGGSILGISRTVSRDRMRGFEYLRIVERESSLVYVAQPGGKSPTEFVLTKIEKDRAVFDNPRHDYPQRITYTLTEAGGLKATIGFINGGKPRPFEFQREKK